MKKIITLMFFVLVIAVTNTFAQTRTGDEIMKYEKILIVYYSRSGNTYKLAQYIQELTKGDILEIQPVEPYSSSYNETVERARKEIQGGQVCPIKPLPNNLNIYDVIFIGSPIWISTMASPIKTFLSENNFNGKTLIPFYSHGGGGGGYIERDISVLCSGSLVLEGFGISGSGSSNIQSNISNWLKRIGIIN
jgi:flavodoxin